MVEKAVYLTYFVFNLCGSSISWNSEISTSRGNNWRRKYTFGGGWGGGGGGNVSKCIWFLFFLKIKYISMEAHIAKCSSKLDLTLVSPQTGFCRYLLLSSNSKMSRWKLYLCESIFEFCRHLLRAARNLKYPIDNSVHGDSGLEYMHEIRRSKSELRRPRSKPYSLASCSSVPGLYDTFLFLGVWLAIDWQTGKLFLLLLGIEPSLPNKRAVPCHWSSSRMARFVWYHRFTKAHSPCMQYCLDLCMHRSTQWHGNWPGLVNSLNFCPVIISSSFLWLGILQDQRRHHPISPLMQMHTIQPSTRLLKGRGSPRKSGRILPKSPQRKL